MILDASLTALLIGTAAYFIGGSVKGAFGFGLPMVAVPLLASVTAPATAISLMFFPVLVNNVWQVFHGGYYRAALRRFWPLLAVLTVTTVIAAQFVASVDPRFVAVALGIIIVVFALYQLTPLQFTISTRSEAWLAPLIGAVSGIIGGISGLFGPPLVVYLVALRLPKDAFIATVSMCNLIGMLPLFAVLAWHGFLDGEVAMASGVGAAIAWLGLLLGAWSRNRIPQDTFRKILLCLLILVGLNLIRRSLM